MFDHSKATSDWVDESGEWSVTICVAAGGGVSPFSSWVVHVDCGTAMS